MIPLVRLVHVRWEPVAGATGYEIRVNGSAVATTGSKARTSKIAVGERTHIAIVDLPARSQSQEIDLVQTESPPEGGAP